MHSCLCSAQELEEDPEMRARVALFRDPQVDPSAAAAARRTWRRWGWMRRRRAGWARTAAAAAT
jgi:hypothetical protein